MNRVYAIATAATAGFFVSCFAILAAKQPAPSLVWNASASVPIGLYRVAPAAELRPGDLVAIAPPADVASFLAARHYLPEGLPLLKHVAALPGARVCRSGVFITVNGAGAARALPRDPAGRPLPVWHGCRIVGRHEIFLVNASPQSLDGRYFGPFPASGLLGIARPILTRATPDAPLRWHPAAAGET